MENEQIADAILTALQQLLEAAGPEWTLEFLNAGIEQAGQGGMEQPDPMQGGPGAMPPQGMPQGGGPRLPPMGQMPNQGAPARRLPR